MTAANVTYAVAAGGTIYAGRTAPGGGQAPTPAPTTPPDPTGAFDSVAVASDDGLGMPSGAGPYIMGLRLHASGSANTSTGKQYRAQVSGRLAYAEHTEFAFSTVRDTTPNVVMLRPVDNYGKYPSNVARESHWAGFKGMPDDYYRLITENRVDALMVWQEGLPNIVRSKMFITGSSMGGWGALTYGTRRPDLFGAIYAHMPKWRYAKTVGTVAVPNYGVSAAAVPVASAPQIAPEDGGGSQAVHLDVIAYVADTNNDVPWIGWAIGSDDAYTPFSDHIAAVAALRAAERGFAFSWNAGGHTTAPSIDEITSSYPYGLFEIGKGYPLFTEHSLDQDPAVDAVGGINIGLTFDPATRVETASTWSIKVTSKRGACTVKVKPISKVFTANVGAQLVTIPAANTWVTVTFNA